MLKEWLLLDPIISPPNYKISTPVKTDSVLPVTGNDKNNDDMMITCFFSNLFLTLEVLTVSSLSLLMYWPCFVFSYFLKFQIPTRNPL
jgi:hypothetical protein